MSGPRLSIIPARAATDRALKPRDLQVLWVLGRHTDDLGWARRSQVKMAEEMGCARSTVFEAVERLVQHGYLERHVQESDNGRDSAHVYRVILDPKHPDVPSVRDSDSGGVDPCRPVGTPAGISAPPAGPEPAPPAGPGPAPINDSTLTTPLNDVERERERETSKTIETAFWRVVKDWPNFAGMPKEPAKRAWLALSPEDRAEAERRLPDWFALLKAQKKSLPPAPSTYFNEKLWRDVPEQAAGEAQSVMAPPFGPVWAAVRLREMLTQAPQPGPPAKGYLAEVLARGDAEAQRARLSRRALFGWSRVNTMHERALARRGVAVAPHLAGLEALMEPVPVGSPTWDAWRAHHEAMGWPWLPDPGAMRVVYFPKGGPAGLGDFETALARGNGDDGDRHEAAE